MVGRAGKQAQKGPAIILGHCRVACSYPTAQIAEEVSVPKRICIEISDRRVACVSLVASFLAGHYGPSVGYYIRNAGGL
jgi:hypothetical protein